MKRSLGGGFLVTAMTACSLTSLRVAAPVLAADHHAGQAAVTLASEEEGSDSVHAVFSSPPQPMLANVSDEYQVVRLWPRSDALAEARDALEQSCETAEFQETPFREFISTVARKAGVRISLDHKALENIGFDTATPITANLTGRSFRAGLREVLRDCDLAYVLKDDHIRVTTADRAAEMREAVFYPVIPQVHVDEVAVLIEETVEPESWSHRGGKGTIVAAPAGMGHGLIISHAAAVQEEIEAILRNLDGALWNPVDQDEGVTAVFVRSYVIEDDDLRTGLEQRLAELCNESLPHGADADARIEVIGRAIVVRSRSRPFQVMAAQIIAAVIGEVVELDVESDEAATHSASDSST